jgi:hypothetical protein
MYPSTGVGSLGSSGNRQVSSSTADKKPCFMSFSRRFNVMVEGVQSCSAMALERGRGQHLQDHGISSYFPPLFHSPIFSIPSSFLFRHREEDKEKMASEVHGCRDAQGRPPDSNPTTVVVKQAGPSQMQ